jgi:hypothetical protein
MMVLISFDMHVNLFHYKEDYIDIWRYYGAKTQNTHMYVQMQQRKSYSFMKHQKIPQHELLYV